MFLDQLAFNHFIHSSHDNSDAYTPSGIHLGDAPKDTCHKGASNQFSIQNLEVAKALEILGEEAWMLGCIMQKKWLRLPKWKEMQQDA
jgi:hypothetical protein